MGIAIPIFIMIASLIMVSMSFAWFTQTATSEIRTINLTTKDVFILDFSVGAIDNDESKWYNGQKALDEYGYLRSPYQKVTNSYSADYARDYAYSFKTEIGFSTDGTSVDMAMSFKIVQIAQYDSEELMYFDLAIYGEESTNNTNVHPVREYETSDIPYAFTWFFVESGADIDDYHTSYYTPYGKLDFAHDADGYNYVVDVNDRNDNLENEDDINPNTYSILNRRPEGIKNFSAEKNGLGANHPYDLYIVFAPEELYWMQFFKADIDRPYAISGNNGGVYASEELPKIYDQVTHDKMYYSSTAYTGANFYFIAEINVSNIYGRD